VWAHPGPRVWGSRPLRGNQEAPSQTGGHARCSARETAFVRAPWVGPPNRASPMRAVVAALGRLRAVRECVGRSRQTGLRPCGVWGSACDAPGGACGARRRRAAWVADVTVREAHDRLGGVPVLAPNVMQLPCKGHRDQVGGPRNSCAKKTSFAKGQQPSRQRGAETPAHWPGRQSL
jgi:hypothetical protein